MVDARPGWPRVGMAASAARSSTDTDTDTDKQSWQRRSGGWECCSRRTAGRSNASVALTRQWVFECPRMGNNGVSTTLALRALRSLSTLAGSSIDALIGCGQTSSRHQSPSSLRSICPRAGSQLPASSSSPSSNTRNASQDSLSTTKSRPFTIILISPWVSAMIS